MGLKRVYYVGEGIPTEVSYDRGRTWETVTVCKTFGYGSDSFAWAPAGMQAERQQVSVRNPNNRKTGRQDGRTLFVAVSGGPEDSFLDLTPQQFKGIFGNNDASTLTDLVLETDYYNRLNPEQLRNRAETLLALAEEKEPGEEIVAEEAPKPRKKRTRKPRAESSL